MLCNCSPDNDQTGYTINISISNIPAGLSGNDVVIDVIQKMSSSVYVQTGQINSQISGTSFNQTIKAYNLSTGISASDKHYTGNIELSFSVYIDVNGNNQMNDITIDVADGINYQNLPFSSETIYSIDYTVLHIAGT
jgi:3,4-dihydroxy-2-butanone 4-phosphate synthase